MKKKILLSLGTVAMVVTPIAAVISCNDKTDKEILKEELKKVVDATSTKNKAALNTALSTKTVGQIATAAELGYTVPKFSDKVETTGGFEVVQAYNSTTGTIKVKVKLMRDGNLKYFEEKTITITAKP